MGLTKFKIVFDNPQNTYYPGQTVTGQILFSVNSTRKVHGIKLTVKGDAITTWAVYESGGTMSRAVTLTGQEQYMHYKYYILGSAFGPTIEFSADDYSYPFTFELPNKLPSSFEHKWGRVRYTVSATLDHGLKFDQEVKAAFTILSDYNLNTDQKALEPVDQLLSKTFGYFCYGSKPMRVNIKMPVKGYVPGQTIPIRINIDNDTGVIIERIKLSLVKKVTFRVRNPKKEIRHDKIVVAETDISPIERGENTYEEKILVPPIPPSNLTNCSLIDIEYYVKLEACAHGLHANLMNNTPVIIGTIPLEKFHSKILPVSNTNDASPLFPASDNYPNLPKPSYDETICIVRKSFKEAGDGEHVIENDQHFAPRYPVYKFKKS
ncbi:hypothetical protein HCN44_009217 [Aphidius gifuensis]|uniref:Arrestin C-terminal-like domain-containing protein n=1 Tax=Aphidius gifuensis TaxID=684658 RepID=A0A835CW04_APHGI|nr:arrestin domain-containing protein 17-like [Aphidius gifuensis]KAF7997819.1 hypothetical protein HCN44_009217 [Aphidius gifuensis]